MTRSTFVHALRSVRAAALPFGLGLGVVLGAGGLLSEARAAEAPADGGVALTIVRARATGVREGQAEPTVDPQLATCRKRIKGLNLNHAHFTHDGTDERKAAWGEQVKLPIKGGGTLALRATRSEVAGHAVLNVEETPPGATTPCLAASFDASPGAPVTVFCDRVPADGTIIFFVSVEPVVAPAK